jgi:hypothetical protein
MTPEPQALSGRPVSRKAIASVVSALLSFMLFCSLPLPSDTLHLLGHSMLGSGAYPARLFAAGALGALVLNGLAIVLGILALRDERHSAPNVRSVRLPKIGLTVGAGTLLLMLVFSPFVARAREAARRTSCRCYLKQIGLAMHNYHEAYGSFPPVAIYDNKEDALLSWRVLILPYLNEAELFAEFHLDEPWDSPHNLPLADRMPLVYHCPSSSIAAPNATTYIVVTGDETAFPPHGTVRIADIRDGTDTTLMVGEVNDRTIVWSKPEDVVFDDNFAPGSLNSGHDDGWAALFADGTVRFIRNDLDPGVLHAIATIRGSEILASSRFDP